MPTSTFTFLNHAGFLVRSEHALLLADPWVEGALHNGAWRLMDPDTTITALIAELNAGSLPVFVWCSRATPDRLSIAFLRRFRTEFRGIATFLYRPSRDWRLFDELRRQRCATLACPDGQSMALAPDLRITTYANGEADSTCLIGCGRRTILALGEYALASRAACQAMADGLRRDGERIDLLLTGFAAMAWCGNPDGFAAREASAERGIERLALQAELLRPRLVVPVASFARFSRADNAWLNHGRHSPQGVLDAPRLREHGRLIRFLAPGMAVDLDLDTLDSLQERHALALAHWTVCWRARPEPLPRPPQAQVAELKNGFLKLRLRAARRLHGLPQWLERLRLLRPLVISLPDLRQTIELSYRSGLRLLARDAPADLAMCSGTALYLLSAEDGFDVTYAGGCFWTLRAGGLSAFGRFFLPQRMGRRGLGRERPWITGKMLLRTALGWARRGVKAGAR